MKIVMISDTHGLCPEIPSGDILIHAGDLTNRGYRSDVHRQLCWLEKEMTKFRHTILVPGNHDFYFEGRSRDSKKDCRDLGINLLLHKELVLDGIKFFGSPYTPNYHNWAFNVARNEISKYWEQIPSDTRVLITHGPPYRILDFEEQVHYGDRELLKKVKKLSDLKLHVFGHIHDSFGRLEQDGKIFVNAAYRKHQQILVEEI